MAKIDYDVGDLIYAVQDGTRYPIKKGQVFTCKSLAGPDRAGEIGVVLGELRSWHPTGAFIARCFRKLPKKSLEFFAGEKQVVKDLVPAE